MDCGRGWRAEIQISERTTSSIGRVPNGLGMAKSRRIRREGEIRMDSGLGRARSGWIRQGEIRMDQAEGGFCELLELDWWRGGGQSII